MCYLDYRIDHSAVSLIINSTDYQGRVLCGYRYIRCLSLKLSCEFGRIKRVAVRIAPLDKHLDEISSYLTCSIC